MITSSTDIIEIRLVVDGGAPPEPGEKVETLPPPDRGLDGMQDALSQLYLLVVENGRSQELAGEAGVETNRASQKEAERQRDEAMKKAKEEAEKGGFFGAVCDAVAMSLTELNPIAAAAGISAGDVKPIVEKALPVAMVVAGAALSVFTAGTAAALVVACVAIALSAGGAISGAAGGPKELTLSLQIGGAVCSAGSGLLGGAAAAGAANVATTSTQGATSGAAAAAGGAATSSGAAGSSSVNVFGMSTGNVKIVSDCVNGTNAAVQGGDTIVTAVHTHAADEAQLDATRARQALEKLQRLLDAIVDSLKESQESRARTCEIASETLDTYNQTLVSMASMRA